RASSTRCGHEPGIQMQAWCLALDSGSPLRGVRNDGEDFRAMFDIGWSELVVIGIVALIAIGPKELPGVLRTVGTYMGKIRRMASEFQGQFQEAMREAEMADIKKSVDEMTDAAKGFTDF